MIECNFCKKEFKNISSLNSHKKTAKYCLKIQGNLENVQNIECEYCNKVFTAKKNLLSHLNSCETYKTHIEKEILKKEIEKEYEIQALKDKKEYEIRIKEYEIQALKDKKEYEKLIIEKDILIAELKAELKIKNEIFTDDHKTIRDIALQPKNITNTTTNTTNNKILNMTECNLDTNRIKKIIDEKFDCNYMADGQEGLARFAAIEVLRDDEQKLTLVCTDPSRRIFKYKDDTGEIQKDVQCKKLTTAFLESGLKSATNKSFDTYIKNEDGTIDHLKFDLLYKKKIEIDNIESDNSAFVNELSALTAI